jgi:hypothetical protein
VVILVYGPVPSRGLPNFDVLRYEYTLMCESTESSGLESLLGFCPISIGAVFMRTRLSIGSSFVNREYLTACAFDADGCGGENRAQWTVRDAGESDIRDSSCDI